MNDKVQLCGAEWLVITTGKDNNISLSAKSNQIAGVFFSVIVINRFNKPFTNSLMLHFVVVFCVLQNHGRVQGTGGLKTTNCNLF